MVAYALSNYFRSQGAVTVLGGPHSRSYPEDAVKYFDYAVGFCDKNLVRDILQDCAAYRPKGQILSAQKQPSHLPGVIERWKFMKPVIDKAPVYKILPTIGSLGCPYKCSFCIDALVPYQPLEFESLKEDLRFVLKNKPRNTIVTWQDPNFGIQFDNYMEVIEDAVPPGKLTFLAEMSLSLLNEKSCKRLAYNGFQVMAPGIESWFDIGEKSKMRSTKGMEKVRMVAEQVNMIRSYIPYVQTNLILGLDADEGPEPFELTKQFIDLAPGVFPYFSLLMSYGRNAPDNLRYQQEGRVLNIPFHFLNQLHAMNVRPQNYQWQEFFGHVCDVFNYAFSPRAIMRRFLAGRGTMTRFDQLFRGWKSERVHKYLGNHRKMFHRLQEMPDLVRYLNGETTELPSIYVTPIKEDLEWLWPWLPEGAIYHDPNIYLKSLSDKPDVAPQARAGLALA